MRRIMAAAAGRAVLAATAAAALLVLVGCSEPPTRQTSEVAAQPPPPATPPVADTVPAPQPSELGVTPESPNALYARIGLAEGTEGVMVLMLDESGGEGTGYDTLYTDTDLDGKLTREGEKLEARPNYGDMAMAQFAPFELAGGDEGAPRQMSLYYFGEPGANEHSLRATIIAPQAGEGSEDAMVGMLMGEPALAATPGEAAVWRVYGDVALEMQTQTRSGRMLCVALTAKLGDAELYAPQAKVDLVIRTPEGEVLTREHGSLGEFGFGWGGSISYSVRVPGEARKVVAEATTDVGPFGGEVTATQEVGL